MYLSIGTCVAAGARTNHHLGRFAKTQTN